MAEMGLTLTCPAFIQGGPIAPLHTCDGMDTSPALQWSHTPPETSSFILLMEDADAPNGPVTHWVLFDIPGSAEGLAEQEVSIGIPGRNDLHHEGYTGPCPPPPVAVSTVMCYDCMPWMWPRGVCNAVLPVGMWTTPCAVMS